MPVPFVRELPQAGPADAPRVTRMQKHPPRILPGERRTDGAHGVLRAGRERGDARARAAVVLAPVAVAAPPHLVDAPLRDLGAELRLVVDDRRGREVVHLPAGATQAELQIDLLRVEEEVL